MYINNIYINNTNNIVYIYYIYTYIYILLLLYIIYNNNIYITRPSKNEFQDKQL